MPAPTFDQFKHLTAKFPSLGRCGHQVNKGDHILWNREHGAYCSECSRKWRRKVAAEQSQERLGVPAY